jgi:hypothetical protein
MQTTPEKTLAFAIQLNLSWLFFAAEILRRKYPHQRIGFLGRDCQQLYRIYETYFNADCVYVPFSRLAAQNVDLAVNYLKSFNADVLVDISSTGATWQLLGQKHCFGICTLIYADCDSYTLTQPIPPPTFQWVAQNSIIGPTNKLIELLNGADHGSLVSLRPYTVGPLDLSPELTAFIQEPVKTAVANRDKYAGIREDLARLTDQQLARFFVSGLMTLCDQYAIWLIPECLRYLQQDEKTPKKLSKYFCEIYRTEAVSFLIRAKYTKQECTLKKIAGTLVI